MGKVTAVHNLGIVDGMGGQESRARAISVHIWI